MQIVKQERQIEEVFVVLKPACAEKSLHNWNVGDLKYYKEQLKAEFVRINEIMARKQFVSEKGKALIKS